MCSPASCLPIGLWSEIWGPLHDLVSERVNGVSLVAARVPCGVQRVNAVHCFTIGADSHRHCNPGSVSYPNDAAHPDSGPTPRHRGYGLSYDQSHDGSFAIGYACAYRDTGSYINSHTNPGALANPHRDPRARANAHADIDTDDDANADDDAYAHTNCYPRTSYPISHAKRATHHYPCADIYTPANGAATAPVCLRPYVGWDGSRRRRV